VPSISERPVPRRKPRVGDATRPITGAAATPPPSRREDSSLLPDAYWLTPAPSDHRPKPAFPPEPDYRDDNERVQKTAAIATTCRPRRRGLAGVAAGVGRGGLVRLSAAKVSLAPALAGEMRVVSPGSAA